MGMESLPITARQLKATEVRLQAIYEAARMGLQGDALALSIGMLPQEYRRLCEVDDLARLAAMKGRADDQLAMSKVLHDAARAGDAKAALDILKHQHDWVAKQQVQVDVRQQISVVAALEAAQARVEQQASVTIDAATGAVVQGAARLAVDSTAED
jgi:phosphohistidine swiveling domain-containing protein